MSCPARLRFESRKGFQTTPVLRANPNVINVHQQVSFLLGECKLVVNIDLPLTEYFPTAEASGTREGKSSPDVILCTLARARIVTTFRRVSFATDSVDLLHHFWMLASDIAIFGRVLL
jgi:hypothetical protein